MVSTRPGERPRGAGPAGTGISDSSLRGLETTKGFVLSRPVCGCWLQPREANDKPSQTGLCHLHSDLLRMTVRHVRARVGGSQVQDRAFQGKAGPRR